MANDTCYFSHFLYESFEIQIIFFYYQLHLTAKETYEIILF